MALLLPAACCRGSTFVCTRQRLVLARAVLWCTSGLASMKHFATVLSETVAAYFFICIQFFSGMFFFNQGQPWIWMKQKKRQHVWYVYIRVIRVHIRKYTLSTYQVLPGMIQLKHYSSVAACSGYTSRDSQYTAARVHVPGIYYIVHTLQQQTATAVKIVLYICIIYSC